MFSNRVIDQYKLEAEIQDDNAPLPVRFIATNTDDESTAEMWVSISRVSELFEIIYGEHAVSQFELLREQHYHKFIASATSLVVVNSNELVDYGFSHEELRPWKFELQASH